MTHQQKLEHLRDLRQQLHEAEERLMIADNPSDRWAAGSRYDIIVAAIEDLQQV
jgi:hypothetical protein